MENKKSILTPAIDLEQTGNKIKTLRKENGFSVHELQDLFGFEYPQAIYAWESGKNFPVSENLLILAHLFHVEMSEIVVTSSEEVKMPCSDSMTFCMYKKESFCKHCVFKKIS
jgi:transcriptional regulator with XRE-family HTH domain